MSANDRRDARKAAAEGHRARRWPRRLLAAFAVVVTGVLAGGAWLLGTSSGAAWLLARVEVPGEIAYARLDGSVLTGLELVDVHWENAGTRVSADRLAVAARPDGALRALVISRLQADGLRLRLPPVDPARDDEPFAIDTLLPSLASPLPIVVEEAVVDGFALVHDDGTVTEVLERFEATLRWDDAVRDIDVTVLAPAVEATLRGDLALAGGETRLALRAAVNGTRWHPDLPADLSVAARMVDTIERADLEVRSEALGLLLDGDLDALFATPRLRAELALGRWAPARLVADGFELFDVQGRIDATVDAVALVLEGGATLPEVGPARWEADGSVAADAVRLEQLAVQAGDARLTAVGQVALDARPGQPAVLDLDLAWSDLAWPLEGPPQALSRTGSGRLQGVPEDWRFMGGFELETPGYPAGAVELEASGNLEGAGPVALTGSVLGGTVRANGFVRWVDAPVVEATFATRDLDVGALLPDWPLRLSAEGGLALVLGEEPELDLDLASLGGQFQGEPIGGGGRFEWRGDALLLDDVRLSLGTASVDVAGEASSGLMRFDLGLSIGASGWVSRQVGGPLAGRVTLDSSARLPVVRADLTGGPIVREDLSVEALSVRREDGGERLQLEFSGIERDGARVERLGIALRRAAGAWRVDVEADAPPFRVLSRIDGAPGPQSSLAAPAFEGQLSALRVDDESGTRLNLRRPAPLALDAGGGSLSRACLGFDAGGTGCVDAAFRPGEALDLDLEFERLSLGSLVALADPTLSFTQRLTGTARWHSRAGAAPTGEAAIDISAGQAGLVGEETTLRTGPGFAGFVFDDRTLRNGRLELPLADGGQLRAEFGIDGIRFDGSGEVSGEAHFDMPDLGVLAAVAPALTGIGGSLSTSLLLGGTVADPTFDGAFDLSGATFVLTRLGARVEDLNLRGRVDRADRLTLRGQFRMGEGEGTLGVEAGFADIQRPELSVAVIGESLAVVQLPDLEVEANPDLALAWRDGVWNIQGSLLIPRALVVPESSFVTRVDESDDVVVVAGERVPVIERARERPVEFYGGLALALGGDVRLEMDIASLGLSGDVDLAWNGVAMPKATGEVRVDGPVTVWGPRLNIERGRVRWDGAPVENPTLDIRAERDVFGSSLIRRAGVRVSGTARRPDVEAFTQPLTNSDRAWTLLVTGSDVDFAEGVGAFDVGTYIAPRLFLSYGISLFDSENVVGLRYDLRRGWGVKVSSGQRESGVDLSYTIEQQ